MGVSADRLTQAKRASETLGFDAVNTIEPQPVCIWRGAIAQASFNGASTFHSIFQNELCLAAECRAHL